MTLVLLIFFIGLALFLLPYPASIVGKANQFGLVLIFWAVYFMIAGFGGRALRFADVGLLDKREAALQIENRFTNGPETREQPLVA